MDIHFLGTGSAYPGAERDNTSLCLSADGTHVLIDVSGNPCKKLKQINVGLGELDTVIFTHFHIDHIYGLPSLLWGMWLEHREKPLHIFCDKRNEAKLNEWLDTMEVHQWGIKFPIEIHTFNGDHKEEITAAGDMRISCFRALHQVPTVGLEIDYHGKKVVYSGDSEVNAHIKSYPHIDMLIHEATFARGDAENHASVTQIVEAYELRAIDKVMLVHLSDNEPYNEEIARLGVTVKVKTAHDMMKVSI